MSSGHQVMDVVGTCSSYGRAPCVRCVLLSFLQLTGDLGPRWALQVIVLGGGVAPSQVFGVDRRRYRKGPFSRETAQAKAWAGCGGGSGSDLGGFRWGEKWQVLPELHTDALCRGPCAWRP